MKENREKLSTAAKYKKSFIISKLKEMDECHINRVYAFMQGCTGNPVK